MSFRIVIPARYASGRLPGKPLLDLAGKPMIVRVAEAAAASGAVEVVVATDDPRIAEVTNAAGFTTEMTGAEHATGSDRVMEVANRRGWGDEEIVLNLQGDEPLVPAVVVDQLPVSLTSDATLACATLCEPIDELAALDDPNVVKVTRTVDGRALYFSRAPIPYARSGFADSRGRLVGGGRWLRHIGLYAYRLWALRRFVGLSQGALESVESLEQLRFLENGMAIQVEMAADRVPGGVDTAEDLERVRLELARRRASP